MAQGTIFCSFPFLMVPYDLDYYYIHQLYHWCSSFHDVGSLSVVWELGYSTCVDSSPLIHPAPVVSLFWCLCWWCCIGGWVTFKLHWHRVAGIGHWVGFYVGAPVGAPLNVELHWHISKGGIRLAISVWEDLDSVPPFSHETSWVFFGQSPFDPILISFLIYFS